MTGSRWRPGPPLLGLLAGWLALFAWSGLVLQPGRFLVPALLVGLLMVLVGSALRMLDLPAYAVGLTQLVVALLCLNLLVAGRESLFGVVPTEKSVRHVVFAIYNGAATLNHYSAPVEVNPDHTRAMLTACGLAVLLTIDVLAMGLRRPPLVALPLLVTLSIPVSILTNSLALPVFVGVALLFLRLLAAENLDRVRAWGGTASGPSGAAILSTLWQVSLVAVVVALLTAPLVPVSDLLTRDDGGSGNGGSGGRYALTSVNPFIHLQRDLVVKRHTPLVYARTDARSSAYLRTTVLDEFTSDGWQPAPRSLPRANDADGRFPTPPGLALGLASTESSWSLELAPGFSTAWLPLPYPIRELNVPGEWRYDSRTLDVAHVSGAASRLKYRATAFTPIITADVLDLAPRAGETVRKPMTLVPAGLPAVVGERAREVTRGATSDFAKAVALQDWFRDKGGFRYSLDQRSGSGMDLLAAFVTNDRAGYCEQFAAAMAAMGRVLGIPSRVVVGFLEGTVQSDGRILYTSDDRHAWPEMYFTGVGWVRFEPTPAARAGSTPSWTRQSTGAAEPVAPAPSTASRRPAAAPDRTPTPVTVDTSRGVTIPWWPVAALVVVLVLGIAPGLVRLVQRRRRLSGRDAAHLAEGAWSELGATAVDLGLSWPEQRSPREQARGVLTQVTAQEQDLQTLEHLLVSVEQGRYGRGAAQETVDAQVRAATVGTVGAWRKVMVRSVDRQRGWRSRVWPMSLLRRRQ